MEIFGDSSMMSSSWFWDLFVPIVTWSNKRSGEDQILNEKISVLQRENDNATMYTSFWCHGGWSQSTFFYRHHHDWLRYNNDLIFNDNGLKFSCKEYKVYVSVDDIRKQYIHVLFNTLELSLHTKKYRYIYIFFGQSIEY